MEKINIPDELTAKIGRYVKEGRFSDYSDFFIQAANLLLMAEDNKGTFEQVFKKENYIEIFVPSILNFFSINFSVTQIFVLVCIVISDVTKLPPNKPKNGINWSARCLSTVAGDLISFIKSEAHSFPTSSADFPFSPIAEQPSLQLSNNACAVIELPVEKVFT